MNRPDRCKKDKRYEKGIEYAKDSGNAKGIEREKGKACHNAEKRTGT